MKKWNRFLSFGLIGLISLFPCNGMAYSKTETVYSYLKTNGEVSKTSINVHLTNLDKGDILDYSYLDNIQNRNGDETFSKDSKKITWKSTGKDIFYQGALSSQLPISISSKFYLNGEEMSVEKMKGKKGTIRMEFSYQNQEYDVDSGMYTPFVMSLVSILPSKNISNVTVTNGKVVPTGNRTIVVGMASPGLYESTHLEKAQGFDSTVIEYETSNFEMNEVYFIATPKLLEDFDFSGLQKVDELAGSFNTLQNGMDSLEIGSKSLLEGASSLENGLGSLNGGLASALDGSSQITSGLSQIQEGSSSISSLTVLVDTLFTNYQENIQMSEKLSTIKGEVLALKEKENEIKNSISSLEVLESMNTLSEEQTVQLTMLREGENQIEGGLNQYRSLLSTYGIDIDSLDLVIGKVTGANEAIGKVLVGIMGVNSMEEVTNESILMFHSKIDGLLSGISSLENGSSNLTKGLQQLYNGSNSLVDGGKQLTSGTSQLSDGISKINQEGIKTLSSYGKKAISYSNKVEKLIQLSKEYTGFSGDNVNQTVFLYKLSTKN